MLFFSWDDYDARVVCRQLDYIHGKATNSYFAGYGSAPIRLPIWLDNVQCIGTEDMLSSCPHNGWRDENCLHREDAGVRCGRYTYTHNTHIYTHMYI